MKATLPYSCGANIALWMLLQIKINRLERGQVTIRRGDILWADLGMFPTTSVQGGVRPVIVVSNNKANTYSSVITVVPLTSRIYKKRYLPTHVFISKYDMTGIRKGSLALAEQVMSISTKCIIEKCGRVNKWSLDRVLKAVRIQMGTSVSAEVEAYEPLIRQYANQYGIGEYVELIKAIMMQESGGRGLDPMQCSEGSFNTKYPKQPNGITDPEYSISCGVQEIKSCLERAGVKNPLDMENIKLALQSYNYGNGYLEWAKARGGYTLANAAEFSDMMAQRMGWSSYGDKQYVPHVLQYYAFGRIPTGIGNQAIVQVAASQEGKGGTTYWRWYGFGGRVEWCACFVSWCADQSGYIQSGVIPKFSLCSDGVKWFESKGRFRDGSYTPVAGDIIFFDWGNNGTIDHVGIVESVSGGTVNTIEGNSGDKVARRSYSIGSSNIYGYGVPAY